MSTDAQAGAQNIDEQKDIIAELCVGAPNDTIRNCLRKYDPSKGTYQIEKELKKDNKDRNRAFFLGVLV